MAVGNIAPQPPSSVSPSTTSPRVYAGPKQSTAYRPRSRCGLTMYDTKNWPRISDPNPLPQHNSTTKVRSAFNYVGPPPPFRHEETNHNHIPARMMSERYTSTEGFDCGSGRLLFMTGKPRVKQRENASTNYYQELEKVLDTFEGGKGTASKGITRVGITRVGCKAGSQTARGTDLGNRGSSYRDQYKLGTLHADKYRTGFVYKPPAFSDALPSSRTFSGGEVCVPASPTHALGFGAGFPAPTSPRSAPTSTASSPRSQRVKKAKKTKVKKAMTARAWVQNPQLTNFQRHMATRVGTQWGQK